MSPPRRRPRWRCLVDDCPIKGRWRTVARGRTNHGEQHAHYLAKHLTVENAP